MLHLPSLASTAIYASLLLAHPVLAPGGPATPGPTHSPGPRSQYIGGRSLALVDLEAIPSGWDLWWHFNRAPFVNLKALERTVGFDDGNFCSWYLPGYEEDQREVWIQPGTQQIGTEVIPALLAALQGDPRRGLQGNTLLALAKMSGSEKVSGSCEAAIREHLDSEYQRVSERATLALGILGGEPAANSLEAISAGTGPGKRLVGRAQVPMRTRLSATYGLGLIGAQTADNALRVRLVDHFVEVLRADVPVDEQLMTAAVIALGLTPIDSVGETRRSKRPSASIDAQVTFLLDLLGTPRKRGKSKWSHSKARLHVPGAIARLLSAHPEESDAIRSVAIGILTRGLHPRSHFDNGLKASCALALGQIVDCRGGTTIHKAANAALKAVSTKGDQQTSCFALMAMGQIAARRGPESSSNPIASRKLLMGHLRKQLANAQTQRSSWAALSLGITANTLSATGQETVDIHTLSALRTRAKDVRKPGAIGASLLALGLCKDLDIAGFILDRIRGSKLNRTKGQGLVALGLMDHQLSSDVLQSLMEQWPDQPDKLIPISEYMGMVGDWKVGQGLIHLMGVSSYSIAKYALAHAVGNIEDRNNIRSLISLFGDKGKAQSTRNSAVVALGIACDRTMVPWQQLLSTHINYHALDTFLWNTNQDPCYNTEPGLLNYP
ncbi:MAG: hypothetical protein JKY61_05895 [Planctomycetes bacterium]|nr:hypothetical protein [Planctomycetota bacterium]